MKKFTRKILFMLWIGILWTFLLPGMQAQNPLPTNDSLLSALTGQVNPDSVENYMLFLQDMETRFLIAPNRRKIASKIAEKFMALGAESARIDSFICHTSINMGGLQYDTVTWQYNVIGTLSGMLDSEDYYVMGAHYDDVVFPDGDPMLLAPGADDNASGVAALFETVRIFSENDFLPMYSIEFVAFAAEELMYYGHSGAQAYVDSAMSQGKNLHMMINNDMIAHTADDDWKIWISNYEGNEVLTSIGEFVTENYTEITPLLRPKTDEAGADAYYFYEAGVPCIYFMEEDFNPYYHTENDLVENISIDYCVEAIKASVGVLVMAQDTTITGIETFEPGYLVSVYPNPTSGNLTIETELPGQGTHYCYIRDINGRTLESFDLRSSGTIDIGKYSNGLYILQVVAGEQVISHKILLRKY